LFVIGADASADGDECEHDEESRSLEHSETRLVAVRREWPQRL